MQLVTVFSYPDDDVRIFLFLKIHVLALYSSRFKPKRILWTK